MNTNDLIIKLGNNLDTLTNQYSKCITTNNYNEGLNVMKNIDMVVKQLKELDFQTMTSKYGTYDTETGEEIKELAIWKQNGFGQIKDHEVFKIGSGGSWCSITEDNTMNISAKGISVNDEQIDELNTKGLFGIYEGKSVLIEKHKSRSNQWYNILKFFIETKQSQLIQLGYSTEEDELKHRCTGKTSAIVRLANDFNIPIYTNKLYCDVGLIDRSKEFNANTIIVDDLSKLNIEQCNKGILLVDESADISKIKDEDFTIIGFTRKFNK